MPPLTPTHHRYRAAPSCITARTVPHPCIICTTALAECFLSSHQTLVAWRVAVRLLGWRRTTNTTLHLFSTLSHHTPPPGLLVPSTASPKTTGIYTFGGKREKKKKKKHAGGKKTTTTPYRKLQEDKEGQNSTLTEHAITGNSGLTSSPTSPYAKNQYIIKAKTKEAPTRSKNTGLLYI